ncbi:MAG: aminotransferase class IV [Actinomycetota bacterium]|nr:aminotransferase class IV [Actinomycetota bacterium]
MKAYLNDGLVRMAEARVSIFDHGFLYGDGVYETMRVYDGVVFMLEEHLKRLSHSAAMILLDLPKTMDGLKSAIYDTLDANGFRDAYLRLAVTRGEGPIGLDPALCKRPTLVIYCDKLKPPPLSFKEQGMKLAIVNTKRNCKEALDPQIKSLNFLNNILAKAESLRAGADEGLMLNMEGHVAEGTTSNIFFVHGGALCTPASECGILKGITRDVVISIAGRLHMKLAEGKFTASQLLEASEAFVTSSIIEIMPVGKIGDTRFKPGEVTKALMAEYAKEVQAYVKETKESGPSIWGGDG